MSEECRIEINDLNKKQYEIFNSIINTPANITKYHIIRASRQSGKTYLLLRISVQFIFQNNNKMGAVISASYSQFRKLWRDLLAIIPSELIIGKDMSTNIIYFINGTSLQFFTAKNYDAIVGNTFDFLLGDEVALYPKDALGFITPVLAAKKDSKAVFVSTPRGKNEFYTYCMKGEDDSNPYIKEYLMSYLDNDVYDLRAVEEARINLPDALFKSEYLAQFIFGQSSVFGNFTKYQTSKEFEEPIKGNNYYAGLDISGTGDDSTILTILNSKGKPVCIYETTSTTMPEQAAELIPIILKYNDAHTKIECNGLGIGLANLIELKCSKVYKFYNSNAIKNKLVLKMKESLASGDIQLPSIDLYPKLDYEMSSYKVKQTPLGMTTFEHATGCHDDSIDSIMMANLCRIEMSDSSGVSTVDNSKILTPTNRPTAMQYKNYLNDNY